MKRLLSARSRSPGTWPECGKLSLPTVTTSPSSPAAAFIFSANAPRIRSSRLSGFERGHHALENERNRVPPVFQCACYVAKIAFKSQIKKRVTAPMTIQTGAPRPRAAAALRAFEAGGNRRRGLADRPDCGRKRGCRDYGSREGCRCFKNGGVHGGFARIGRRGAKDML